MTNDTSLFEVEVRTGSSVEIGQSRRLFSAREKGLVAESGFDVTGDGRFLLVQRPETSDAADRTLVVVENWPALLDAR